VNEECGSDILVEATVATPELGLVFLSAAAEAIDPAVRHLSFLLTCTWPRFSLISLFPMWW
jgi:hypothetical protein